MLVKGDTGVNELIHLSQDSVGHNVTDVNYNGYTIVVTISGIMIHKNEGQTVKDIAHCIK